MQNCVAHKPNPDALFRAAELWRVLPSELLVIGDSLKDDMLCANRAGASSIFIDNLHQVCCCTGAGQSGGACARCLQTRPLTLAEIEVEIRPTAIAKDLFEALQLLQSDMFELRPADCVQATAAAETNSGLEQLVLQQTASANASCSRQQ